jgi:hypothetical protein
MRNGCAAGDHEVSLTTVTGEPTRFFAALVCGPVIGILVYVVLLRLTKSLAAGDLIMLGKFESRIPLRLRRPCREILKWIAGGTAHSRVLSCRR